MDRKVVIIHCSGIIQAGIAEILQKHFSCKVSAFMDLKSFLDSNDALAASNMIFVDYEIADSRNFIEVISEMGDNVTIVKIVPDLPGKSDGSKHTVTSGPKGAPADSPTRDPTGNPTVNSTRRIFIHSTPEEIDNQFAAIMKQEESANAKLEGLSDREIDVLKLVALGHSNKEIADKLFISIHTVMSHRKNMTEKLGIKSISGLTVYAIINNYIDTTNLDLKDLI